MLVSTLFSLVSLASLVTALPHTRRFGHSRRYVVPSKHQKPTTQPDLDVSGLRARSVGQIFSHSPHTFVLKRQHDVSRTLVRRGKLHPLLFFTQHLNQALSRRAKFDTSDLSKRGEWTGQVREESLSRMLRRWKSLHAERGQPTPKLQLNERGMLIPASRGHQKRQDLSSLLSMLGFGGSEDPATSNRARQQSGQQQGSQSTDSDGKPFNSASLQAASDNTLTNSTEKASKNTEGLAIQANDVGYSTGVPSQQCNQDGTCAGHKTLSTTSSKTLAVSDPPQQFQITYGSGNVAGVLASDDVSLGAGGLTVKGLQFGITTEESQQFASADVPFDGLMGLSISTLSEQQVPTFIEALAKDGSVSAAQMGYHLGTVNTDNAPQQDSTATFGGVDSSKFNGDLLEIPNQADNGFWIGGLDGVTINGKTVNVNAKTAILDTGTSLIIMPTEDATAIHSAVPGASSDGQGGFLIPCTTTARIAFEFGGKKFPMNPTDLAFIPVTDDPAGMCQSSISSGQIDQQGSFLLGDSFLKNVYLATDVGSNTIGLAIAGDAANLA